MDAGRLSRRDFARTLGAGLGAALLDPGPAAGLPAAAGTEPAREPIQLDSNENPYGPSARAREAMLRSQAVAARYPDGAGKAAAEAIAKHHGVAPENVVLGCGSSEILRLADMAFVGPGRTVIAAEPTFEAVLAYAKVARGEGVKVPSTADFRHDLPRMAAACDDRTGLLYVCNPNNPTGTIVTRDELSALFAAVPKRVTVLVDEAYFHFVEEGAYASACEWLGKLDNLVVARTFSKIHGMAGMRLGYALGHPDRIKAMREHLVFSSGNVAVLEAAIASLGDVAHVAEQRRLNNETRRWLCAELERDGRRFIPSHANFLMIQLGSDAKPVIEAFRQRGILVGRRFPALGDWLRVTIGTRAETEAFLAALRAIVPAAARAA